MRRGLLRRSVILSQPKRDDNGRLPDLKSIYDTYEKLAHEGYCDAPDGAEYKRVLEEWEKVGRPDPEPFIRDRANWWPGTFKRDKKGRLSKLDTRHLLDEDVIEV